MLRTLCHFANTRDTNVRPVALIAPLKLALQFEPLAHNPCLSEFPHVSLTRLQYCTRLMRSRSAPLSTTCMPEILRGIPKNTPTIFLLNFYRLKDSAITSQGRQPTSPCWDPCPICHRLEMRLDATLLVREWWANQDSI